MKLEPEVTNLSKDDPARNPDHLGNLPKGYKRAEENLKRTDRLAEQAAEESDSAGGISADALQPEREILVGFDPVTKQLEVTAAQVGRHYVWVKDHPVITAWYAGMGYVPVQGEDPECAHFKSKGPAAGSSLRGFGDVLLYWVPRERHAQVEAHFQKKADAMLGVEENWEQDANYGPVGKLFRPLAHGNPNDALLRRTVFRGSRGQIERLNDALKSGKPLPAGVHARDEAY